MAAGVTRISDVVVPEIFTPYVQQLTTEKSRLIRSGAIVYDEQYVQLMSGGGLTFNQPSFRDLDNDEENVGNDNPTDLSTPNKIGTNTEIQVRLNRNNSWSSMNLAATLAGADPMQAIANRVADYWVRRMQATFVATHKGVLAQNALANPVNAAQNDMTYDISGASFVNGITNFSTEAFIDACLTMGDSMEELSMIMVHSVVYGRMQKNNLIDFIPDARGEVNIPTFLGRQVIIDDGVPHVGGVFDSWLFGAGAYHFGSGTPHLGTEIDRVAAAGKGSGQDILHSRKEWILHPVGNAYVGTSPAGGPSNAATANNLAAAASWNRVYGERKMIKMARLVTREF